MLFEFFARHRRFGHRHRNNPRFETRQRRFRNGDFVTDFERAFDLV
jgi:hypothetical protein